MILGTDSVGVQKVWLLPPTTQPSNSADTRKFRSNLNTQTLKNSYNSWPSYSKKERKDKWATNMRTAYGEISERNESTYDTARVPAPYGREK